MSTFKDRDDRQALERYHGDRIPCAECGRYFTPTRQDQEVCHRCERDDEDDED